MTMVKVYQQGEVIMMVSITDIGKYVQEFLEDWVKANTSPGSDLEYNTDWDIRVVS